MAYQSILYQTKLPDEIVTFIQRDLAQLYPENELTHSFVENEEEQKTKLKKDRNSKNAWVPAEHWTTGFLMHYVNMANTHNFCYDLKCIDGLSLQYTSYGKGCFYNWHSDQGVESYYSPQGYQSMGFNNDLLQDKLTLDAELVRKISFSLQLSNPNEYEGGELQLMNDVNQLYEVPKEKGILFCFDSRAMHRVRKVKSGCRKSLVGWMLGPRWR